MQHPPVVIVGGGIAGVMTAETLRKKQPERPIIIIDQEPEPLYSRVLLPHYIKRKVPREKVFLKTASWYSEQKIIWKSSTIAQKISSTNKCITLGSGEEVTYNQCVIATGTSPRPARGHVLQTLQDADDIGEILPTLQEMHIVGGGFMACEFVNIAAAYGISAHIYLRGGGFWNSILPEEVQRALSDRLRAHGGVVHAAEEIPLSNPHIFWGIGAPAQNALAEQVGCIMADGGIATDEYLQTSTPHIFAAGDVAAPWVPLRGRHIRTGNWQNALAHGRSLGQTVAGIPTTALQPSAYATDLLGLSIIFLGDPSKERATRLVTKRKEQQFHVYYYEEEILIGAVLVGDPLARPTLLKALGTAYVPT